MDYKYNFHNVFGSFYNRGNLVFSKDSNNIYSANHNRLNVKNLVHRTEHTLSPETREDIDWILISETNIVYCIDVSGYLFAINIDSLIILCSLRLGGPVSAAHISTDGLYICVSSKDEIALWKTPCEKTSWQFSRVWQLKGHNDRCNQIKFVANNRYILSCGNDMLLKLWSVEEKFNTKTFVDAKQALLFCDMTQDGKMIIAGGENGRICIWIKSMNGKDAGLEYGLSTKIKKWQENYAKYAESVLESINNNEQAVTRSNIYLINDDENMEVEKSDDENNKNRDEINKSEIYYANKMELEKLSTDSGDGIQTDDVQFEKWVYCCRTYVLFKKTIASAAAFNPAQNLIVYGTMDGLMILAKLNLDYNSILSENFTLSPDTIVEINRIQVSNKCPISTVAFNTDGYWIAFGGRVEHSIGIWEWKSGTYVLKDASDTTSSTSLALMPIFNYSGTPGKETNLSCNIFATGSLTGQVTIWDMESSCIIKEFSEHEDSVSDLVFNNRRNLLISCSLDGTIRFFDIIGMKSFKKFDGSLNDDSEPVALTSLDIDISGKYIAVVTVDNKILLYDIMNPQPLDIMYMHAHSIKKVSFTKDFENPGRLASCDISGKVIVWDIFGRIEKKGEPITLVGPFDMCLSLCWNPNKSNLLYVSYTGGHIAVWDVEAEEIVMMIEGLREIHVGRETGQADTANNQKFARDKWTRDADPNLGFDHIEISWNGEILIAANKKSHKICVYNAIDGDMLYSFYMTKNRSFDGLLRKLNSKNLTLNTDADQNDFNDKLSIFEEKKIRKTVLPGASRGIFAAAKDKNKFFVFSLILSYDERNLLIGTNHGVYFYKKTSDLFTKYSDLRSHALYSTNTLSLSDLNPNLNVNSWRSEVLNQNNSNALQIALALNINELISSSYIRIPKSEVPLILSGLNNSQLKQLLVFLLSCIMDHENDASSLISNHLYWLNTMFDVLKTKDRIQTTNEIRPILKSILFVFENINKDFFSLYEFNVDVYTMLSKMMK